MAVQRTIDSTTGIVTDIPPTPDDVNYATLQAQALAAFNTNRAAITRNTANVAAANPTTLPPVVAALKDALNQLSQLEAQNNALMRLVLGLLDGTN